MSARFEDTVIGRLPNRVVVPGLLGFVVVLGALAVLATPEVDSPVPYLTAFLLALGCVVVVLLPWPRGHERLVALAVAATVLALGLLVLSVLPDGKPGYALWHPSFVWLPLSGLALRGHAAVALLTAGASAATTVWWTHATPGVGFLDGLNRVVSPTATVLVSVGIAVLVRQYAVEVDRVRREQLVAARLSAGARAAEDERRSRLAQIEQLAAPVLLRLRDAVDVDERLATECRLLEAALRDGIRGRQLVDPAVRETVWAARTRGVHITVLDDSGDDEDRADPDVAQALRRCVVEVVEKLENGTVTVRMAASEEGTLVVVTPDAGDVALLCRSGLSALDRPVAGVRVRMSNESEDVLAVTVRREPAG